jgi:hypothetical protein
VIAVLITILFFVVMRKNKVTHRRIMNEAEKSVRKQFKTERVVEYYQLTYLLVVIKSNVIL